MKTLRKDEMLKKDQVCRNAWRLLVPTLIVVPACTRTRRARRARRIQLAMGRPTLLLLPGLCLPLSDHGVPAWGRSHDDADQVRHLLRRCDTILHCGVCARHRGCPLARLHPSVSNMQLLASFSGIDETLLVVISSRITSSLTKMGISNCLTLVCLPASTNSTTAATISVCWSLPMALHHLRRKRETV